MSNLIGEHLKLVISAGFLISAGGGQWAEVLFGLGRHDPYKEMQLKTGGPVNEFTPGTIHDHGAHETNYHSFL